MKVLDIFSLPDYKSYTYIMSEKKSSKFINIDINNPLVRKDLRELSICGIYADGGVVVEVKFNKNFWKIYPQLVTLYENNKDKF